MPPGIDLHHFVDRGAELARLDSALRRAVHGDPSVVVVSADAGVGKTRLLHEFARRTDARVLWGGCLALGERGLPFAPIVEALRNLADDTEHGSIPPPLARLISGTDDPGADHAVSRSQLFQAILGLIEDLARQTTTALVLEDLHWADPSTRDLLQFLVPNLRAQRVLVVVSYRTDDVQRGHPLRSVLAELGRHPRVQRVELPPFSVEQVAQQLEHLTGAPPADRVLRRVASRTQGNAYFVEELVAAGLERRDLPTSLRQLLLVRADVVGPAARRLLRIASLAERDVSDVVLGRVSDTPLDEVRAQLREAIDAQLLESTPGGVRFRHALLREVLQQDLLTGERVEYHAAYARVLQEDADTGGDDSAAAVAELAHHLKEAGRPTEAMRAFLSAAGAAEAVFAFAEAHQHLSDAIDAWDAADDPEELAGTTWVRLVARAAEAAFLGGEIQRACDLARAAIAVVDEQADPRRAGILYERLSRYLIDSTDRGQVRATIERAVQLVPASPPSVERARVLAGYGGRLMMLGRLVEARNVSQEAAAMARLVGADVIECVALNTLGAVNCYLDDLPAGLPQIDAALALATACGDAQQQMRAYWNGAVVRSEAGRYSEAIDRLRIAIHELARLGFAHLLPELHMYVAQDLTILGRWAEAQAAVDDAEHRFPTSRDEVVPIELLTGTGRFDEARRVIGVTLARGVFGDEEGPAKALAELAELEVWEGHVDAARAAVDDVLERMLHTDRPIALAHALWTGLRCEADVAGEARARRQADELGHALSRGRRLHGHLCALRDRPGASSGWKRVVGAVAAIGVGEWSRLEERPDAAVWSAAVQANSDLEMRYLLAYATFRRGEAVMAATGDREQAADDIRGALDVARALGAGPLQRLIEAFARRARLEVGAAGRQDTAFGITAREREVLALVVGGATNRQIAEQLFIAEKTASVHVSHIIRKLGVTNRGEAAAVAHREGLVDA